MSLHDEHLLFQRIGVHETGSTPIEGKRDAAATALEGFLKRLAYV
jgi:hypothetical protein